MSQTLRLPIQKYSYAANALSAHNPNIRWNHIGEEGMAIILGKSAPGFALNEISMQVVQKAGVLVTNPKSSFAFLVSSVIFTGIHPFTKALSTSQRCFAMWTYPRSSQASDSRCDQMSSNCHHIHDGQWPGSFTCNSYCFQPSRADRGESSPESFRSVSYLIQTMRKLREC